MSTTAILWPSFALVALVIVVWFVLVIARMRHIRTTPPTRESFATGGSALKYFQPVEMPANNLRNLLEMPVLFFALVPLLIVTAQVTVGQVVLAWGFVLLRALHSYVHIATRNIMRRAQIYWLSCAALMAMWIGFFLDMLLVARA